MYKRQGQELAPEFICYPFAVTMGQMRQCLEAGANTIIMVGGKGRCRLGWYAELQEILLRRAGYKFEMLTIDSPFPLRDNYSSFMRALAAFYNPGLGGKIAACALLAFCKALFTERAEARFYELQARESSRGAAYSIFQRFLRRVNEAAALGSVSYTHLDVYKRQAGGRGKGSDHHRQINGQFLFTGPGESGGSDYRGRRSDLARRHPGPAPG